MSKRTILILAIITMGVLALAGKLYSDWRNLEDVPVIQVTPLSYDLGTVIYGQVATHTLRVGNVGRAPLIVQKLSTSCGCTKAFMDESAKNIPPGGESFITVTFDPTVHKDDTDVGDIVRVVYIKSNDPVHPEVEAEIRAFVMFRESLQTL